jgi:hypothetical protein
MPNDELEVFGFTIIQEGKKIVIPPAMDHWKSSRTVKEILWMGNVENYGMFNMVQGNLAIIILVTGFENYCKMRFFELEKNGIIPDVDAILRLYFSKKDIDDNIKSIIEQRAQKNQISLIQQLSTERRLNFQNYTECSKAFFQGYGIKFDELGGITSQDIHEIKKMINYRHRLIHVNPLITMLNELNIPPETPIFISKDLADKTENLFDKFITSLHTKTINMLNS